MYEDTERYAMKQPLNTVIISRKTANARSPRIAAVSRKLPRTDAPSRSSSGTVSVSSSDMARQTNPSRVGTTRVILQSETLITHDPSMGATIGAITPRTALMFSTCFMVGPSKQSLMRAVDTVMQAPAPIP